MAQARADKPTVVKLQAETVALVDQIMCSKRPWPAIIAALQYVEGYVAESIRLAEHHEACRVAYEEGRKEAGGG